MRIQIRLRELPRKITMWSLEKSKILVMTLLLWSVQHLVSLLLLLFKKIFHRHLHLFNHVLVKTAIKRQEDKVLERKWGKCWEIVKIKEFKGNFQRPKLVQIQRKKNFSKTYQRGLRDGKTFFEKVCKIYTSIFNEGANNESLTSHYQPSTFGSLTTSSFS